MSTSLFGKRALPGEEGKEPDNPCTIPRPNPPFLHYVTFSFPSPPADASLIPSISFPSPRPLPKMRTVARNFPHCSLSPSFFFHVAQKIFSAERPSCLPRRRLGEASAGRQVVRGRRAGRKAGRERARGRSTREGRRRYVGPVWTVGGLTLHVYERP